jgi:hypothetical protein
VTDLVYLVRPGDDNEELRYSLRSVARNLPDAKVWIAGHTPAWVTGVNSIELVPLEGKFDNQKQSLRAACEHPDMPDEFVLMNDDFFVMTPDLPVYHLGPNQEYIFYLLGLGKTFHNGWFRALVASELQLWEWGHKDSLCYESHSPLPFHRDQLLDVIKNVRTDHPFLYMQYYPIAGAGGEGVRGIDAKAGAYSNPIDANWCYLSSSDQSFPLSSIGRKVRSTFGEPCKFERSK